MKTKKKGPAPRGVKQALEFVIGLHMGTVPVCTREGLGRKTEAAIGLPFPGFIFKTDQRNRPLLCHKIAAVLILFSKVSLMYALMVNPAWRANIAICR